MGKVSIIMPSLNVVNYIKEAMESVISQTLTDIEIICVDAGSTDGTLEILKEYEACDSRVRVLHSDKKSYGYQMNLGIQIAQGEYIGIVETDDYIVPEMYEELYINAVQHDADVVKSDFDMFTTLENGKRLFINYSLKMFHRVSYNIVYSRDKYLDGEASVECYIWNAIYKKDFLMKNQIKFNETPGAAFQDFGFKYLVAFAAEKMVVVNKSFYRYRRDNSGSSTYNNKVVEYNLAEAKYLLAVLKECRTVEAHVYLTALKEIIKYAFGPYIELLRWKNPSEGTKNAFMEYRELLREFIEQGIINANNVDSSAWLNVNLLLEDVNVYNSYAKVLAKIDVQAISGLFTKVKSYNNVVIFGSGYRGTAIGVFLLINKFHNIVGFCDNDKEKWGTVKMELPVVSPMEAAKEYSNALYIISNLGAQDDMRKQLNSMGIKNTNILVYKLDCNPSFCTNCMVKEK